MPRKPSEEDILATARERFKLIESAEVAIRREALIDLQFCSGDQWDAEDENRRRHGSSRRPCLTFNKLTGPLNMVANEARQNQPAIEVHPVDSQSDPDTAQVIQGLIRHIEYVSKADEVYETALEQSTAGSFGYFKIASRYCGPMSFDQELRIERIADPFNIYIDPFANEADKSDMRYAFEVELIPRDDYEQEYGDTAVAQNNFYANGINPAPNWIRTDGILVACYWTVEIEKKTLVAIDWPDGKRTTRFEDDVPDELPPGLRMAVGPDGKPLRRETEVRKVCWYKINGIEILEQGVWPGQWIPIFAVLGKEMYVDGDRQLFSLVRFARGAQQLYNFYRSSEAETVLLGTKAPWIGAKGIFRDPRWATANSNPWSYLEYEPTDISGQPAQPPTRNIFEPPIQALSLGAAQASDDIKSTTNIYDAALGAQGPESSGIAIQRRQSQSGMANMHFIDNLNRAIRQCGACLCDLIPKIYDTPREVRILGEDRTQQIVKVNQQFQNEQTGQIQCYDLTSGKYDVTVQVGPSYNTQRQETWATLTQFAQAYPPLLQIAGDIIFQNADFAGADQIAERFQKSLPPGMLSPTPGKDGKVPPAVYQQQIMQQDQKIQQLTAALSDATQQIQTKQVEKQSQLVAKKMELDSNERIEQLKIESSDRQAAAANQVKLIDTEAKLSSAENIELLRVQMAQVQRQLQQMATGAAAEASEAEQEAPAPQAQALATVPPVPPAVPLQPGP